MMINDLYMEDKNGDWSTFYVNKIDNNWFEMKEAMSEVRMIIYQAELFLRELGGE